MRHNVEPLTVTVHRLAHGKSFFSYIHDVVGLIGVCTGSLIYEVIRVLITMFTISIIPALLIT